MKYRTALLKASILTISFCVLGAPRPAVASNFVQLSTNLIADPKLRSTVMNNFQLPASVQPRFNLTCALETSDPSRRPFLVPYDRWSAVGILNQVRANRASAERMLAEAFPAGFEESSAVVTERPLSSSLPSVTQMGEFVVDPVFVPVNAGLSSGGHYTLGRHRSTPVDGALKDYQALHLRPVSSTRSSSLVIAETHRLGTVDWSLSTLESVRIYNFPNQTTEIEFLLKPSRCFPGMLELTYSVRLHSGGLATGWSSLRKPASELSFQCMTFHLLKSVRGRLDFVRRKVFDLFGAETIGWDGPDLIYNGTYECTSPFGY